MAQRFVFTGKQSVCLENFDDPRPGEGKVLIRVNCSLMSTGTENIVFNRLFDEGTHWDNWVKYPFHPGYLAVGEIIEVGNGVVNRKVGQRVATRYNHMSHLVVNAGETFPIPDGLDYPSATWFGLAKIAFIGALAADYHIGESAVIVGAGPIGQMALRWAVAAGQKHIVVVDPVKSRLDLALAGGATAVIDKAIDGCKSDIEEAAGGVVPHTITDSTGNASVFSSILAIAPRFGRVVILGDTGSPTSQRLTSDVLLRGLTIVGAHDGCETEKWTNSTINALYFDLVQRGEFKVDGLITNVFKPRDVEKAYHLVNTRRGETMGVLFDWSD